MAERREKSRATAGGARAGPKEKPKDAQPGLPTPPWQLFSDLCEDHGIAPETAWALALAANHVDHQDYDETMRHPGLIFQALDHGDSPRTSWQEAMAYQGYEPHVAWDLLREHGQTVEYPEKDADEEEGQRDKHHRGKKSREDASSRKRQQPKQGGRTSGKDSAAHTPTGSAGGATPVTTPRGPRVEKGHRSRSPGRGPKPSSGTAARREKSKSKMPKDPRGAPSGTRPHSPAPRNPDFLATSAGAWSGSRTSGTPTPGGQSPTWGATGCPLTEPATWTPWRSETRALRTLRGATADTRAFATGVSSVSLLLLKPASTGGQSKFAWE